MWNLETPWTEIVIRASVIFLFLFVVFRFIGKKHIGELSPFDLILLLIMSEAVQNGLIGDDHGIPAALIVVVTIMSLNVIINRISFHFEGAEKLLEGRPKVLIYKGKIRQKTKDQEKITDQELYEALRQEGILDPSDVYLSTLETSGKISVIKKKDAKPSSRVRRFFKRLKAGR